MKRLSKMSKIMPIKELIIPRDQIGQARVPESCAPFVRTIPSCQNHLKCDMGQHISFWGWDGVWWNSRSNPYGIHVFHVFYIRKTFWAPVSEPGFWDFRIFRFSILDNCHCCEIFLENMLVRYQGINNKGVLERPWTKWGFLLPFLVY